MVPKGSPRETTGSKRIPKASQMEPKESQREPKGCQKAAQWCPRERRENKRNWMRYCVKARGGETWIPPSALTQFGEHCGSYFPMVLWNDGIVLARFCDHSGNARKHFHGDLHDRRSNMKAHLRNTTRSTFVGKRNISADNYMTNVRMSKHICAIRHIQRSNSVGGLMSISVN